jgi:hypothetical protein
MPTTGAAEVAADGPARDRAVEADRRHLAAALFDIATATQNELPKDERQRPPGVAVDPKAHRDVSLMMQGFTCAR